jgi:hypothetical protein
MVVVGDLDGLLGIGVEGMIGDSIVPPRVAPALPELPELRRLTRSRSRSILSMDGVGEFR